MGVLPNVAYLTYDGEEDEDSIELQWSEDRSSFTIDLGLRSRVGLPDSIRLASDLIVSFKETAPDPAKYKWLKKK